MIRRNTSIIAGVIAITALATGSYVILGVGFDEASQVFAQGLDRGSSPSADGNGEAQAGAQAVDNAVARQAREWGVATCAAQVDAMSQILTNNSTYSARSTRGPADGNKQLFSATIAAKDRASGREKLAGLSVAPVTGGGCNASYEAVTYLEMPCPAARSQHYPAFAAQVEFGDVAALFATADARSFLYMLPAGAGCVAVEKQVIY